MTYTLRRTLPSGEVKEQGPFTKRRQAVQAAFFVLLDNRVDHLWDAAASASRLEIADRMETSGYTFEIVAD